MTEAICLQDVEKKFEGFHFGPMTFSVPKGCIVGYIGENGAGKSTTIKLLLGMIRSDAGKIRLLGRETAQMQKEEKQQIGCVFDDLYLPGVMTVKNAEVFHRGLYGEAWQKDTFYALVKRFHLPENRTIRQYSRGMRMQLGMALALSHGANLLLLDEATSGLDPVIRDDVLDLLLDFMQQEDHTVLISSHILSDIEKVADYITFIHKGKLIFTQDKDTLIDNYGIISCGAAVFDTINKSEVIAYRKEDYQFKVLVYNRTKAAKQYPNAIVSPATIEEIMLFYIKGEIQ